MTASPNARDARTPQLIGAPDQAQVLPIEQSKWSAAGMPNASHAQTPNQDRPPCVTRNALSKAAKGGAAQSSPVPGARTMT